MMERAPRSGVERTSCFGCSRARNHLLVLADAMLPDVIQSRLKDPTVVIAPTDENKPPF